MSGSVPELPKQHYYGNEILKSNLEHLFIPNCQWYMLSSGAGLSYPELVQIFKVL